MIKLIAPTFLLQDLDFVMKGSVVDKRDGVPGESIERYQSTLKR